MAGNYRPLRQENAGPDDRFAFATSEYLETSVSARSLGPVLNNCVVTQTVSLRRHRWLTKTDRKRRKPIEKGKKWTHY